MSSIIVRRELFEDPSGTYTFALQGFVQAKSVDDPYAYIQSQPVLVNQAGLEDIQPFVDRAGVVHDPSRPRPAMAELPEMPTRDLPGTQEPNGYYPFSEAGTMLLGDLASGPPDFGSVEGFIRVNVAGVPGGHGQSFRGRYNFDDWLFPQGSRLFSGNITIQFNDLPSHVWDYRFAQVSDNEMLLTAGARVPRPCVATGTMRKVMPLP